MVTVIHIKREEDDGSWKTMFSTTETGDACNVLDRYRKEYPDLRFGMFLENQYPLTEKKSEGPLIRGGHSVKEAALRPPQFSGKKGLGMDI